MHPGGIERGHVRDGSPVFSAAGGLRLRHIVLFTLSSALCPPHFVFSFSHSTGSGQCEETMWERQCAEDNVKEDNVKEDNVKEDNVKEDNVKEDNVWRTKCSRVARVIGSRFLQ